MKTASILGIMLVVIGIVSLAYFTSPLRLMFQETLGLHRINLVPPILGALALVGGIILLIVSRPGGKRKSVSYE
jgi:hypothetical protein